MMNVRGQANNGVWCCLLLPLALWSSSDPTPPDLKLVTLMLSLAMACFSLHAAYRLIYTPRSEGKGALAHFVQNAIDDLFERTSSKEARLQRKKLKQPKQILQEEVLDSSANNSSFTVMAVIMTFTLVMWLQGAKLLVIVLAAASLYSFPRLLIKVFRLFPGSFTFGECCVATQAFLLTVFEGTASLLVGADNPSTIDGSFAIIAKAGLLSCLFVCVLPLLPGFHWTGKNATFFACGIVILCGVTIPLLWITLKRNPVLWVMELIASSRTRSYLMVTWSTCVLVAVLVVKSQAAEQVSTRTRKLFHAIMVVAYTSGILMDVNFTYLASIVALCVFLLLESVRIHGIEPFSSILTSNFGIFLDEKDRGRLILTHLYLLVGCSLPLWLSHDLSVTPEVKLLSGVLAIGVGDSAASIFGSKFGKIKFPDSQKTFEGMVAAFVSQLMYLWLLQKSDFLALVDFTPLYVPIGIVSLAEALTNQVDNLVLPLILYVLIL